MRAVAQRAYGQPRDVLTVREVAPPVAGDDQVLVRVRAASVHPDVWHVVTGRPKVLRLMGAGATRPSDIVPGTDMAGVVEAVGADVTRFRPGDEVFGETVPGMQWRNGGSEVTAVDHTGKLELLRRLGADHVVDYTREDATALTGPFDLTFDVVGNHPYAAYRQALTPNGTYVLIGHDQFGRAGHRRLGSIPRMFGLMARSLVDRRLPRPSRATPDRADSMAYLADLLASGAITPEVARTFLLDEVVDALDVLASGTALGRIVITP